MNELVEKLKAMILVRKGEVVDEAVAEERARNIVTALYGVTGDDVVRALAQLRLAVVPYEDDPDLDAAKAVADDVLAVTGDGTHASVTVLASRPEDVRCRLGVVANRLYSENRMTGDEMRDAAQVLQAVMLDIVDFQTKEKKV